MIIMCDKCKKPARISQRVAEGEQVLVIGVHCHGQIEEMRLSRYDLESTPGLAASIKTGIGVAFRQASAAEKDRAEMARPDGMIEVPLGVDPVEFARSLRG